MARDYVKRKSNSYDDSGRWRWPLAIILLLLFAIGIFYLKKQSDKIAAQQGENNGGIISRTLKDKDAPASKNNSKKSATKKPVEKEVTPAKTPSQTPQPKFDFYTMLPKNQVAATAPKTIDSPPPPPPAPKTIATTNKTIEQPKTAPNNKATVAADQEDLIAAEIEKLNTSKPATTTKTADINYIIQLGVFKNHSSADQYKAQLVMQGYEAKIKMIKKDNTSLYRVWLGPYSSLASAKDQQHVLQQNQIKSRITKES